MNDIIEKLIKIGYDNNVTLENNEYVFRYDTDDNYVEENEEEYFMIASDLRRVGLEIKDVYIEHDCISGILVKIEN